MTGCIKELIKVLLSSLSSLELPLEVVNSSSLYVLYYCHHPLADLEERKKERAPEFLSNFNDTLVTEGTEAKLALRFVGYPAPEVTWLFNGGEVAMTDYLDITRDNEEACFYIRIARPEHSGSYTCQLRNKFGLVEVTAQVSVAVKPQLVSRITDQEALPGTESRFTCKYTGFPVPDVTWYHNKYTLTVSTNGVINIIDSWFQVSNALACNDGGHGFAPQLWRPF